MNMQTFKSALLLLAAGWCGLGSAHGEPPLLSINNNQPFPVRMPVLFPHCAASNDGPWLTQDRRPVQRLGDGIAMIADIGATAGKKFNLQNANIAEGPRIFAIEPDTAGIRLNYSGHPLGSLSWELKIASPAIQPQEFDTDFQPLPLKFQRAEHGPVFDRWTADTTQAGLQLQIDLLAYADGFLDIHAHLTNATADPHIKTYAAVVCRWEQPKIAGQTLCDDNHIRDLGARDHSSFRSGQGRKMFTQRGVDWVAATFENGPATAWLNDFAPSFTVVDNSTNNPLHTPRYAGANLSQLGQEVQTVPGRFYSITEIARSNTKTFADRLTENVLPAPGEGVSFSSRLCFSPTPMATNDLDHAFVAYCSYNPCEIGREETGISFGVPSIRFGTSYFPYSTLGENFDEVKLPGMDRESFWPLAADTVLQWRLFADDIRRDLRIAKAMGFQLIRLHHLELLAAIPAETRQEYLDFLFGELRQLRLRALVDIYASPEQLAALTGRYGDVMDGIELENEILIWGIPLNRPPEWKADYDAIKGVAPNIPVNLTGYNNTGMFDRLEQLGVKFDRVDLHSYIDSLDAIPSARGYALAMGSYATKIGRPPMISEWNWRGLTKMSEAERAQIYPPIMENVLATRAIPDFYEFQFNETMAPNPRAGRGNLLRHYELLNLSRRPKLEAFEFMKLIERYSANDDPVRIIESSHEAVEVDAHHAAAVNISITNVGAHLLKLRATAETGAGLNAALRVPSPLTLAPGQSAVIPLDVSVTNPQPGFYHVFVRLESDDGFLRYLWAEVRVSGAPKMDAGPDLNFDLSKPVTVAYSQKATVLEVETAFAVGQTLESATGMTVQIMPLEEVSNAAAAHLIYVGAARNAPTAGKDWLMVGGKNSREVEQAGMNLILRYWTLAKDSAARRVGLVRKDLPRGGDAAKLP
jgi:hypothetical protein